MMAGTSNSGSSGRVPVVLFVTPVLHHPPIGGPELRIENSIKALARACELHVYSQVPLEKMGGEVARRFYRRLVRGLYFTSRGDGFVHRLPERVHNRFFKLLGRPPQFIDDGSPFRPIVEISHRIKADVIWLGFGNISYPLLEYLKKNVDIPVIVDTDSVWSRFILRELDCATDGAAAQAIVERGNAKIEEERWGTALADVTTAVSEIDAEYYRGLISDPERVCIFANVIDVQSYKERSAPPANFRSPAVLLAGSFWPNSPMEDAARWTIQHVLPLLRAKVPRLHLHVLGRRSDEVLADVNDDSVTVHGQVESVTPFLQNSVAALVPLRFESGTRFKILEAGACSVPVVSTTLGAEGLPTTHGHDILIADNPQDFADRIVDLVANPPQADHLAANLRHLVESEFGIESLTMQARQILRRVLTPNPVSAP